MEEEEEMSDYSGFFGSNFEIRGEGNGVEYIVGMFIMEKVEMYYNIVDNEGINVVLEGVDLLFFVVDDDFFEYVLLKEFNKNVEDVNGFFSLDNLSYLFGGSEEMFEFFFGNVLIFGFNFFSDVEVYYNYYFLSLGFKSDSINNIMVLFFFVSFDFVLYFYVDGGYFFIEFF